MRNYIIKIVRNIIRDLLREILSEIIQNRLVALRDIYRKNQDKYDNVDDILMKAKIQALEETYTIINISLNG